MNLKERIREVLDKGYLMSLGTFDNAGVWVADVIYIYDDNLDIYWMSDPDARHSRAIIKNGKVAGTITISNKSKELNLGVQFHGLAEKIDGPRYNLAVKHYAKRSHPAPKETEDVLKGDFWYILRLKTAQLIDEKNFGFDKQTFEL